MTPAKVQKWIRPTPSPPKGPVVVKRERSEYVDSP